MIGGNIEGELQTYISVTNQIGEFEKVWSTVQTIKGFLDFCAGESEYEKYDKKVQQSTHVFICDFLPLYKGVKAENCRMKIGGEIYDVMLIDNPLELGRQYEFYLKYIGGDVCDKK